MTNINEMVSDMVFDVIDTNIDQQCLSIHSSDKKMNEIYKSAYDAIRDKNYELAFTIASNGHEKGVESMTYMLGFLYFFGYGVDKNINKAFNYFLINADVNVHSAYMCTIMCIVNYEGVEQNLELAKQLIREPLRLNYLDVINVNSLLNDLIDQKRKPDSENY